jgi:glutamate--cysteine ligase
MELIYKKGTTLSSMVLGKVESNKREGTCFKLSSLHYQFLHKDKEIVRHRRGRRVIVATGPAIEAPVIATEPLTKDDLIDYMVSGCKPKEKWRYKITIHNLCFFKIK